MEFPEFRELVETIYSDKLMGKKDDIINYVKDKSNAIREQALIDSVIWDKNDYDEEIEYLTWWIDNRFRMMDAEYGTKVIIDNNLTEI